MSLKHKWYRLDNAGRLYASLTSARVTTVFRISATLKETINPRILQDSLDSIIERFPYYQVFLKKGVFWYYFDHTNKKPKIQLEKNYPCMNFDIRKKSVFPFRILYFGTKISFECSHSLTDGTGGLIFLNALLFEYLKRIGKPIHDKKHPLTFTSDQKPNEAEFEESFTKYYNPAIPKVKNGERAYHLPFKLHKKGIYSIVTGIIPSDQLYNLSKQYNVSVTEFLCAIYFEVLLEYSLSKNKKLKPIVLNIPINLRNLLPSISMYNFFLSLTPSIDPRLGTYSFDELIKYIHHYMQLYVDPKIMLKQISRNIRSERNIVLRIIPLFIKNLIMPKIYNLWAESKYTSSISNMGKIKLPEYITPYIDRIEIIPPPSEGNKIKIVVNSYKDNTFLTFGKLTNDSTIERLFFTKLKKMGLPIKIETN